MLTCVGRGGDGQKIRDEILNIMHRNNIKEMKGQWMEVRGDLGHGELGCALGDPSLLTCIHLQLCNWKIWRTL